MVFKIIELVEIMIALLLHRIVSDHITSHHTLPVPLVQPIRIYAIPRRQYTHVNAHTHCLSLSLSLSLSLFLSLNTIHSSIHSQPQHVVACLAALRLASLGGVTSRVSGDHRVDKDGPADASGGPGDRGGDFIDVEVRVDDIEVVRVGEAVRF